MIDKKRLTRYVFAAIILTGLFTLRLGLSLVGVADGITLSGITFLILGLFRIARYLRFYDLPVFGFKKFAELWKKDFKKRGSSVGEYHQFVEETFHQVDFKEAFGVGGLFLFMGMVLSLLR